MKSALASFILFATSSFGAEPKDDLPDFFNLSAHDAGIAASKQANADFAAGRYRLLVYGMRGGSSVTIADKRLEKQGIKVEAIAGCVVSPGILEGALVYNRIMSAKLKARLGRDIFDDKSETRK